jgi:hypothetical protein
MSVLKKELAGEFVLLLVKSAAGDEDLDPLAGHATSIAPRQARSLCCPQRVILL